MPHNNSEYFNTLPSNFENTEIKLRPFYHTDLKNTLENTVFKEKPEKEKGIIYKIFSDKSKTLKTTVKSLLNEIELRENIDSHSLNKINEDICSQHTLLEQLNKLKVHYLWDQFIDINPIFYVLFFGFSPI